MKTRAFAVALGIATAARSSSADALWHPGDRKATPLEASLILGGGALTFVADLVVKPPTSPSWRGPILVDGGVRDGLSLPTRAGRERVATVSDVLVVTMILAPFVDAGVTAWGPRRDRETAQQLAIMDLEAFSLSEALAFTVKNVAARQRPYAFGADCDGGDPQASTREECARKDRNLSYFSGHSVTAFTAATLMCTQHVHLSLYGGAWDWVTCAASLSIAATTATLRIVADRHWLSDVVTGTAIGVLSGFLVPTLLHFRPANHGESASIASSLTAPSGGAFMLGFGGVVL